ASVEPSLILVATRLLFARSLGRRVRRGITLASHATPSMMALRYAMRRYGSFPFGPSHSATTTAGGSHPQHSTGPHASHSRHAPHSTQCLSSHIGHWHHSSISNTGTSSSSCVATSRFDSARARLRPSVVSNVGQHGHA